MKGETVWLTLNQLADEMAGKEYDKFKAQQQALEKSDSLNQLEADLNEIGTKGTTGFLYCTSFKKLSK